MPVLTIDAPGVYHVTADHTCGPTEDGIVINPGVHYATILLHSRLVGAGGPGSTNAGVRLRGNADVKIIGMGGSIRGFQYGVCGDVHYGVPVNIPQIHNLCVLDAWFRGIKLNAEEAIVEGCDIRDVTGCTVPDHVYCMGIEVQGHLKAVNRHRILRNTVVGVKGIQESVGISVSDKGVGSIVSQNIVKNLTVLPKSFGAWIGGQSDVTLTHNTFDGWNNGVAVSSPPAAYLDENAYVNCTVPIAGLTTDVIAGPSDVID